jgi:hypothetical protein
MAKCSAQQINTEEEIWVAPQCEVTPSTKIDATFGAKLGEEDAYR